MASIVGGYRGEVEGWQPPDSGGGSAGAPGEAGHPVGGSRWPAAGETIKWKARRWVDKSCSGGSRQLELWMRGRWGRRRNKKQGSSGDGALLLRDFNSQL